MTLPLSKIYVSLFSLKYFISTNSYHKETVHLLNTEWKQALFVVHEKKKKNKQTKPLTATNPHHNSAFALKTPIYFT